MAQFCSNCGEKVEPSWNACPKCGSLLEKEEYSPATPQYSPQQVQQPQPQPYQQPTPQYSQPKGGTSSATLSLIFGIIGLCCCGFIFGILAIYYGNKGINEGTDSGTARVGLILGVIDLICGCLWFFVVLFVYY